MIKAVLIGCKSTSRFLFQTLRDFIPIKSVVTIDPDLARNNGVADYDDLSDVADLANVYAAKSYSLSASEDLSFFQNDSFDFALVAGWQRLIPDEVLRTFRVGAFGMHGSSQNLPFGRGRSPLNWSIIEGREWFFTNLFQYLRGVDDGPVVDTACFSITGTDTSETLHFKNILAMAELVRKNANALCKGDLKLIPQSEGIPTYYPKRSPENGIIDWRKGVVELDRHIRAVAPPFEGAFSYIDGELLFIDRASIFYTDLEMHPFRNKLPGEVCATFPNGKFCVRTLDGALLIHESRGQPFALKKGSLLVSPVDLIRKFPRNEFGFHDLPQS